MLVIGLTGPSGAGKSTVSNLFASFGLPVLNADDIYHSLLIPPSECLNELIGHFGNRILRPDGTLDRKVLGSVVFGDPEELEVLNRIAHTHVMKHVRQRFKFLREIGTPASVLDAPQLFESSADKDCNIVVSVLADPEIRLHRIMARDKITETAAMSRIRAQKTDGFFRAHSDYVIENNGHTENLLPQVKAILYETGVLAH